MKRILTIILIMASSLVLKAQNAWINEFHYDNDGTDAGEFIEVVIENAGLYNLADFAVVLYNGNGGAVYDTKTLNNYSAGAVSNGFSIFYYSYPVNGIQNGDPDGIALTYQNVLIPGQWLSYEGVVTGDGGPANGQLSIDIGVEEDGNEPFGLSLQLSGDGLSYGDFTWLSPATATAGALNNSQTFTLGGIENPLYLDAYPVSMTQIDLSWELNSNFDSILIAYNNVNVFGTPSGVYSIDDGISGGGTILYKGLGIMASHTGLAANSQFYYKAWSINTSQEYSSGVIDSSSTQSLEPGSHPSALLAQSNGPTHIRLSWNDSDAEHYLIKGSSAGYTSIVPPVDGVGQGDSLLVKNVDQTVQSHQFNALLPNTSYFFKIYPYNGTGQACNYKLNGTVPQATATTGNLDLDLIITEVADPADRPYAKFVEVMNTSDTPVNFSTLPVYLCIQYHSGGWSSVALTGTLAAGGTHIVTSSDTAFTTNYGFQATQISTVANGNGDDNYHLYYGGNQTTGVLLDSYGIMNEDGTGKAWDYENAHAVRKRSITTPNTVWDSTEWVIVPAAAASMTPLYHKGAVSWQGISSTSWNEKGSNWSSPNGYIPDASCDVIIPYAGVSNFPVISSSAACNSLQLQSDGMNGAVLLITGGASLQIVGP